ncbi:MAG: nickel pincer cofactor biosynthesis protein LarB [Clostridiales bacterium]|nr:nickel pincer cofactor biosynthesis protein LarB [Clostridiales bacterium]
MKYKDLKALFEDVKKGSLSPDEAVLRAETLPFEDLGFAKPDYHRELRKGSGEVIYGEGKTAEQIIKISSALIEKGQKNVLITRLSAEKAEEVKKEIGISYYAGCRLGIYGELPESDGKGYVVVATGGTSDLPVAEEAALTAEFLGSRVVRLYDVGVAGIHRLLAYREQLMGARAVVAVAGMEGALASVIGGLVGCPVIAVPTSVGYGASFGGLSALLAMLNSCSSGVSVVNIDNGFGAGYLANMINRIE